MGGSKFNTESRLGIDIAWESLARNSIQGPLGLLNCDPVDKPLDFLCVSIFDEGQFMAFAEELPS